MKLCILWWILHQKKKQNYWQKDCQQDLEEDPALAEALDAVPQNPSILKERNAAVTTFAGTGLDESYFATLRRCASVEKTMHSSAAARGWGVRCAAAGTGACSREGRRNEAASV